MDCNYCEGPVLTDEERTALDKWAVLSSLADQAGRAGLPTWKAAIHHLAGLNGERKQEIDAQRVRVAELEQAVRDLLASADSSWEERGEGNDWREAVERARAALGVTGESEQ